jgi:alpha-beta hydrolase superfamily lysophospholipase
MKKSCRWLWKHRKLTVSVSLLLIFLLLNLVAYLHAYAMTHFTTGGDRTNNPENLSVWQKGWVLLTGVNIPRPTNSATPESIGLAFTVHRFQSADGMDLEAWHVPQANPHGIVVAFHGYAACKSNLLPEVRAFHELGYAVLLVDFRGSGGSAGDVTTIGVTEAEDVAAAWKYARNHWPQQPVVLFGTSMGSAAILHAVAVTDVRPDALVLECPFDKLSSTVANRFASMNLPSFPFAPLLVWWGGVQHGFNGFTHNPLTYAQSVACPLLLLHGSEDVRVTKAQAQTIFEQVSGDKQFEVFEGLGHQSFVAVRAEAWKAWVSPFLMRALARPGRG